MKSYDEHMWCAKITNFFPLRSIRTIRQCCCCLFFFFFAPIRCQWIGNDVKRSIFRKWNFRFDLIFIYYASISARCWWHQDNRSAFMYENCMRNLVFIKIPLMSQWIKRMAFTRCACGVHVIPDDYEFACEKWCVDVDAKPPTIQSLPTFYRLQNVSTTLMSFNQLHTNI